MTKLKKIISIFFIAVMALLVLVSVGLFVKEQFFDNGESATELYYMSANGKMKATEIEIEAGRREDMIQVILNDLQAGIKTDGIKATIPEGLEILSIKSEGMVATIDFGSAYYDLSNVDEVICRSSIVWSLTSLGFIEAVVFTVEGVPLQSNDGKEYGEMTRQNVLIDPVVSATTTEYAILKLYFSNLDATDLIVEDRVVEVNTNQPREKTILEQLIAGPKEKGNYPTIPVETKIMDVTTTSDGVCYVNLSQEFVTKHNGGSTGELLTIYSIVNSLSELENVKKVQFLIEGEKVEAFKGHVDFSTPFVAVKSLQSAEMN